MKLIFVLVTFATTLLAVGTIADNPNTTFKVPKLATPADEKTYRELLPPTDDVQLLELYNDPTVLFYTDKEMPRAYQHSSELLLSVGLNVSANAEEPFGNANIEFPWGTPFGTHRCGKEVSTIRFVRFGGPVIAEKIDYKFRVRQDIKTVYQWTYAPNTAFVEILLLEHPKTGIRAPFEIRTRIRSNDKWFANVYRPVGSRSEFLKACAELHPDTKLDSLSLKKLRLSDNHPKQVLSLDAIVDMLPELPDETVDKLLKRPFRSVLGQEWVSTNLGEGFSPTTKARYHIVPRDYDGAYFNVNSKSCMTCHETIMKTADEFDQRRDWYGLVRGSDNIFSFHIFDPACISYNGASIPVKLRPEFVKAGLLRTKN